MEEEPKFISIISNQIKSNLNSYMPHPINPQKEFTENMVESHKKYGKPRNYY